MAVLGNDALVLLLDDIARLVPQALGLSESVDQRLVDDGIANLVDVGGGEVTDQLTLGVANHLLAEIPDCSLGDGGAGMVNRGIQLLQRSERKASRR